MYPGIVRSSGCVTANLVPGSDGVSERECESGSWCLKRDGHFSSLIDPTSRAGIVPNQDKTSVYDDD